MTLPQLRGGNDYNKQPAGLAATNIDPGLATEFSALGFSRVDGLGRPFQFDDFSGGLADCFVSLAGTSQAQAYGLVGYGAPQCCRLTPSATGGPSVSKAFYQPASGRVGLEVVVNAPSALPATLTFSIRISLGTRDAILVFNNGAWSIRFFSNQTLAVPGTWIAGFGIWTQIKLVADITNLVYIACITPIAGGPAVRTPITNPLDNFGGGAANTMRVDVTVSDTAANPVNVGYILTTIDEP